MKYYFVYILKSYLFYLNKKAIFNFGDWGLGIGPNPQSPIPNPQSPIPILNNFLLN